MTAPDRLSSIEQRLQKITPGPWEHIDKDDCITALECGGENCPHSLNDHFVVADENALNENLAFIAHAPEDIRFLLDEVKRLRAESK